MNDAPDHLPRDLEALRYLDAVDAGDLEAVAEAWERAGRDPGLQEMLGELDDALFVEARCNASPVLEPSCVLQPFLCAPAKYALTDFNESLSPLFHQAGYRKLGPKSQFPREWSR